LLATLEALRRRADAEALAAAHDFDTQPTLAQDAATAQSAAAALQELSASVTQAIAQSAAFTLREAIDTPRIARTITLRGSNLSAEALFQIDHQDLPFRMLQSADGRHIPDILVRDTSTPTFASVLKLSIDPAMLDEYDLGQFQAWFGAKGVHTFTLTNPDGQMAEVNLPIPPARRKNRALRRERVTADPGARHIDVFETGRILGSYAAVGVLKGDSGHSPMVAARRRWGRGCSSNCWMVIARSSAKYAAQLQPLAVFRDFTLVGRCSGAAQARRHRRFRHASDAGSVLRQPLSRPACSDAAALGIVEPLGAAVIYDSRIQGGWTLLKQRIGPVTSRGSKDWAQRYIALRKAWLSSLAPPLPSTVYRMDAFDSLMKLEKWNLDLPVTVHSVAITAEASGDVPRSRSIKNAALGHSLLAR
jgi:chitosanase